MKISKYIALALLAALLLGACSSGADPTATDTPVQDQPKPTATDQPTADAPTEMPTDPPATATDPAPASTATDEPASASTATEAPPPTAAPTDTPVPEDVFAFLEVGPDEWVHGPEDAAVTIIEYADFQ